MFEISRFVKYHGNVITFYPYRKARIRNIIMTIEGLDSMNYMKELKYLCKNVTIKYDPQAKDFVKVDDKNKVEPDNHVVFTIGGIAIMFTDNNIWIGTDIEIGNW